MHRLLALFLILLLAAVLWRSSRGGLGADDVMMYRGEKIKLSKAYRDYDEYKNDPENIHPSETERVQRLLIGAPVAHTYRSRLDLFKSVGEIAFPGYGLGSGGSHLSNGSELLAVTIEIPRANQDRYLVFRGRDGGYVLIDDFVRAEISYPFEIRESDSAYVYVQNGKELFRRARR